MTERKLLLKIDRLSQELVESYLDLQMLWEQLGNEDHWEWKGKSDAQVAEEFDQCVRDLEEMAMVYSVSLVRLEQAWDKWCRMFD